MCEWRGGKTFRQRRPCKCSLQTTAAGSKSNNNNKSKPPLKVRSALSPSHSHTLALIVFVFLPAVFNCIPFCMLSGVRVSICACVCAFSPLFLFCFCIFQLISAESKQQQKQAWLAERRKHVLVFVFVVRSLTVVVELALSHFTCALSRWLACSLTLALNCRAVPVCASSKVNEASTHRRHWRHSVELVLMRAARR